MKKLPKETAQEALQGAEKPTPTIDAGKTVKNGTPRITASIRRKSLLLLDMLYKPSELAEEVGTTTPTILKYADKFNLPTTRDNSGHTWINGKDFEKWVSTIVQTMRSEALSHTEYHFMCRKCSKFVQVESYERHAVNNPQAKNGIIRLSAVCPVCGRKLSKFARSK